MPTNACHQMLLFRFPHSQPLSPLSPLRSHFLTKPSLLASVSKPLPATMPPPHAFAGNPLKSCLDPESLSRHLLKGDSSSSSSSSPTADRFLLLPFSKGRPLARTDDSNPPRWQLAWLDSPRFKHLELREDELLYLGSTDLPEEASQCHYWSIDVSQGNTEWGELQGTAFVELRTLMVATDWADATSMAQLAIAGRARALLEWHNITKFCGSCGSKMAPISAGRRKQCTNDSCKKRIYPRVDPVVIMLVIDKDNDCALLSRQMRFVPRMWSCLAGFIEPGESLEEAVRRETLEETGIEVGEVIYHSSQPWPVGPNSMPCQLMVGFFAYAKSLDIRVDKKELEDAQWHSREDVKKAITFTEYEKAQKSNAIKVAQACKGVEQGLHGFNDYALESGEMAPMFIPGPFAIAHHLISTWVNQGVPGEGETSLKRINSLSNL